MFRPSRVFCGHFSAFSLFVAASILLCGAGTAAAYTVTDLEVDAAHATLGDPHEVSAPSYNNFQLTIYGSFDTNNCYLVQIERVSSSLCGDRDKSVKAAAAVFADRLVISPTPDGSGDFKAALEYKIKIEEHPAGCGGGSVNQTFPDDPGEPYLRIRGCNSDCFLAQDKIRLIASPDPVGCGDNVQLCVQHKDGANKTLGSGNLEYDWDLDGDGICGVCSGGSNDGKKCGEPTDCPGGVCFGGGGFDDLTTNTGDAGCPPDAPCCISVPASVTQTVGAKLRDKGTTLACTGCVTALITVTDDCDDTLFCNGAETCDPVFGCVSGAPPNCDDGIPCTVDTCDAGPDACAHSTANCGPNDECPITAILDSTQQTGGCFDEVRPQTTDAISATFAMTARSHVNAAQPTNPDASGSASDVWIDGDGTGVKEAGCGGSTGISGGGGDEDEELIFTFDSAVSADSIILHLNKIDFGSDTPAIFISSSSSAGFDYTILEPAIQGAFTSTGTEKGKVSFSGFAALPPGLLIDKFKLRETVGHTFVNKLEYAGVIPGGCGEPCTESSTVIVTQPCSIIYPYSSGDPRTNVIFNESEVLRSFGAGQTIKLFYNDEHAMTLGVRRVIVKTNAGTTTTDYPVSPLCGTPAIGCGVVNPLVGTTAQNGDQAGTDTSSCAGAPDLCDRPMYPALFITDTTSNSSSMAGDWQFGGTAIPPNAVYGTWKSAVRMVDKTVSPPTTTVTPDADPAENDWNLDGGDSVQKYCSSSINIYCTANSDCPSGETCVTPTNQGYGTEARWSVDELINSGQLQVGRSYRFQFMVHDGDQNKDGGDVGQGCVNVELRGPNCGDSNACNGLETCDPTLGCQPGTPLNCDDSNPCTTDSCDPMLGCQHVNNNNSCSDGNACTTGDICSGGACVAGPPLNCNDNNVCTNDSCVPATGCMNANNNNSCNDGNACTTVDTCSGGSCTGSTPPNCDDDNVCTTDACIPASGCTHSNNSNSCNDGNACTTGDVCSGGACTGGPPPNCDDGNICTTDACIPPTTGCTHTPNSVQCNDGNLCTLGDVCSSGICSGSPNNCNDNNACTDDSCIPASGCHNTNNSNPCSDGHACTSGDVCSGGACHGTPISGCVECPSNACNDNNPCTTDTCQGGVCVFTNNTASCNDGNACTTTDVCSNGVCIGGPPPNCGDANPCTDDFCDPASGCRNVNNTAACSDSNLCTTNDTCSGGACVGGPPPMCNDGNQCTDDSCNPASGCVSTDNSVLCNDGNACTTNDHCSSGACVGGPPPNCDDGNVCTTDTCSHPSGCVNSNNSNPCNDGHACTNGDVCAGGACHGTQQPGCIECPGNSCDDGNVCTTDLCQGGVCVFTNNSAPCSDGSQCTTGDVCSGGSCVGGPPPNCSDLNGCTDDFCVPASGCMHPANMAACDDGNACTTNDTCSLGACVGGPPPTCSDGNVCTTDTCVPATGCVFPNNSGPCDDGHVCTSGDVCSGGACHGTPIGGCTECALNSQCNDNNLCTTDTCQGGACVFTNNTASCNDGNACTTNDTCSGGVCVGGPPPVCNDENVCTDDDCDAIEGCRFLNNNSPCNDGNFCKTSDTCSGGVCVGGPPPNCNDGNACTNDSCDPLAGSCVHANNSDPCNDGNACTMNDTCGGGTCSGTALNCDDANVCTTDTCFPASGCDHANNSNPCNDNHVCTNPDVCTGGVCVGTPITPCTECNMDNQCDDGNVCTTDTCQGGQCVFSNNSALCSDGNACTTGDVCSGGTCMAGPALNCDDMNGCTNDSCNPASGCEYANNTNPCSDGNFCTTGDVCSGGSCLPGSPQVCNDGNVCTDDSCVPASGCVFTDNNAQCSDGNACTTNDACSNGSCVGGPPLVCNDSNVCTDDFCDTNTGCHTVNNSVPCNDGNLCKTVDFCSGGVCIGSGPLNCNDGNGCTDDLCDPLTGCSHAPNSDPCNDSNACTNGDICTGGVCGGTTISCDDSNVCTTDTCIPASGCDHANNSNPCNDNHDCTNPDVCTGGVCVGTPISGCTECASDSVCNDGNPCTTDTCQSGLCVYTNNTDPCSDGNACTTGDVCSGGSCMPGGPLMCGDMNICTTDSCDPASGCVFTNNTNPCSDGNACTTGDVCSGGVCAGPGSLVCNDNNVCTTDICNPMTGCMYTNNSDPCNDGRACTTGDACSGGMCVGGPPPNCEDGNVCTTNTCVPATGCVTTNNTNPCSDGNACTTGDMCSGGMCVGGPPPNCDDGNVCTDNSCDPALGCRVVNNANPCNDGNACTTGDICSAGSCVGGPPTACDDSNTCTNDSCVPSLGCQHAPNANPCNDGNACTTGDACSGGNCVGGAPPVCDDGNVCTTDTCVPATGCVFTNNSNPCSDGNACTTGDVCSGGGCAGGLGADCDDGDICTSDSCVAGVCRNENTACGACCLRAGPCADYVTPGECAAIPPDGGLFQGVGSMCLGDADSDGLDDLCDTPDNVPTVSEWGLVIMTLLLLIGAKVYFGKRPIRVLTEIHR